MLIFLSCSGKDVSGTDRYSFETAYSTDSRQMYSHLTTSDFVRDIVNHPAFKGFGELLLSRDNNSGYYNTSLSNDRIVNVNNLERRVANLRNAGVEVEYRRYERAGHGFGLGTGTDAEGWVDLAVSFWRRHIGK
jgi:acetyl esterase/lipase